MRLFQRQRIPWRMMIARSALPLLALSASYGVYEFAQLFVPTWVAVVSAAAFEITCLGLALMDLAESERRRANLIAVVAVVVSATTNWVAGYLYFSAHSTLNLAPWQIGLLSLLHSAPIALLFYALSNLLIHSTATPPPAVDPEPSAIGVTTPRIAPAELPSYPCPRCGTLLTKSTYGAARRYNRCAACKSVAVEAQAEAETVL